MIKITRKTKTIFLIVGILFFPFLSSEYLFPSLSTEHFCLYMLPNPNAPAMNNELWTCGYSPAFSLIRPVFFAFLWIYFNFFFTNNRLDFFQKKAEIYNFSFVFMAFLPFCIFINVKYFISA